MWDRLAVKKAMTEEKVKLVHFNSVSLKKKENQYKIRICFKILSLVLVVVKNTNGFTS